MKPFEVEVLEKSIEQKGNMLKGCYDDDLFKSWSGDLQKRFPNGNWKTVNGARVFMNGSKVVAGLDGFNGEIDKFFEEKGRRESKKETKQEFFNLPDIKTKKDLNNNISKILSQYGSRDMASIQVEDYLNENKGLAKEWLQDKGIKSREELKNYLKNRQAKDRKEIVTSKKEEAKKWEQLKTEGHINAIMAMAKEQGAAMDEAIKKQEQEESQKQSPKSEGKGQDTKKEEKDEQIDKLEKQMDKIKSRYDKAAEKTRESFSNVGFGANMRGYKRTSSINFSKEGELRDKMDEIQKQIDKLRGKTEKILTKQEFESKYGKIN